MTGSPVVFIDTETLSLARTHRHLYEVALIVPGGAEDGSDLERVWQLDNVPLGQADAVALNIGRFHERYDAAHATPRREAAAEISRLTWGKHLVGAVPSFDEERLHGLLRAHGQCNGWSYHLIDVEALAAGWISAQCEGQANDGVSRGTIRVERPDGTVNNIDGRPPWKSSDLSLALGVNPDDFEAHTALGDARWARAVYEKVMGTCR